MIHLSSYHSNGLPTVVWSNKVNLIGEKVYKPKIHFCEHCNKPILIYGRLIPCKHVFCFTCATLCLAQQQHHHIKSPTLSGIGEQTQLEPPPSHQTPSIHTHSPSNNINLSNSRSNNNSSQSSDDTTTYQQKCHRCGGKALRVERNTLNSIFVCQIETCRRTYLSARDLQAHVAHRHNKNKSNHNTGASSASLAAISSSPYMSSSSLMHLGNQKDHSTYRQASTNSIGNNKNGSNNRNSPNNHHNMISHRHERDHPSHHQRNHRNFRDRDGFHRDRERERDNKEYHRQSIQRAAQWAEASAQMTLEKGVLH